MLLQKRDRPIRVTLHHLDNADLELELWIVGCELKGSGVCFGRPGLVTGILKEHALKLEGGNEVWVLLQQRGDETKGQRLIAMISCGHGRVHLANHSGVGQALLCAESAWSDQAGKKQEATEGRTTL